MHVMTNIMQLMDTSQEWVWRVALPFQEVRTEFDATGTFLIPVTIWNALGETDD
jgi:hypothetical protein